MSHTPPPKHSACSTWTKMSSGILLAAALLSACAAENPEPPAETAASDGEGTPCGKCDGPFGNFQDAFDDMRSIDLTDLTLVGAKLATDQLNDQLSDLPYAEIEVGPTELYGEKDSLLGQETIHDIEALRSGLTEGLGEGAFATRVATMRSEQVALAPGSVFAESRFQIGASLNPDWTTDVGDLVGRVGFQGGRGLEAMVIAHHPNPREATWRAPLVAIKETRGFVLPRSLEDVKAMSPGEVLALRQEGGVGFNMGVGVPFMIASVADALLLRGRVSLGARVAIDGLMDIQLVRGEGDTAWVDVGVSRQRLRHFEVAATTGWGVAGLPEVNFKLGPAKIDIDDIAEKALSKQLNERITARASASTTSQRSRMTVARFRFHLGEDDEALRQALAQTLRGDLRLAQALANRRDERVVQELDLFKDASAESDHLGFEFLGMKFYRQSNHRTGSVQIEADGQNQTLLFNELERNSGFFFSEKGARWRSLVSILQEDGKLFDAAVNARLTINERTNDFDRDQLLDHADPLLNHLLGFRRLYNEVNADSDAIIALIKDTCRDPGAGAERNEEADYERCLTQLGESDALRQARRLARDTFDKAIEQDLRDGFDPEIMSAAQLADALFETKLLASSHPQWDWVDARVVAQVRFSHRALQDIFQADRTFEFRQRLEETVRLMEARRERDFDDKTRRVDDYVDDNKGRMDEMADLFRQTAERYDQLDRVATASIDRTSLGEFAALVTIPTERPDDLTVASVVEHKGKLIDDIFFDLVDLSERGLFSDLDEPGTFIVGYTLLRMASPSDIELLFTVQYDERDDIYQDLTLYARGTSPFIDAGLFNLDELIR